MVHKCDAPYPKESVCKKVKFDVVVTRAAPYPQRSGPFILWRGCFLLAHGDSGALGKVVWLPRSLSKVQCKAVVGGEGEGKEELKTLKE